MSKKLFEFEDVKVSISTYRWSVFITITQKDRTSKTFIASADQGITCGDGIFFGTEEEYEEATEY